MTTELLRARTGNAPALSYNVPEPTSYEGTRLLELSLPDDWFVMPPDPPSLGIITEEDVDRGMSFGFVNDRLFPLVQLNPGTTLELKYIATPMGDQRAIVGNVPITARLAQLKSKEVFDALQGTPRRWLNVFKNAYGELDYNFLVKPERRPRLLLVEEYRLSSFLGAYGTGRTLNTFTLLPGEKTRLSIKTYSREEKAATNATSILDSFSQESADDFEGAVQSEQSNKSAADENFSYHVDAQAKASWVVASISVKAGVKGGSNSSREEFAKNVSRATEKHAAKASAKRDVQVNTTEETKTETGEETAIEREIQNINVGRTLNFVFRQMNQEFITLLHLVDVKVAYYDGLAATRREVALYQLDSLITEFIKPGLPGLDPSNPAMDARASARQAVLDVLSIIFDYQDE